MKVRCLLTFLILIILVNSIKAFNPNHLKVLLTTDPVDYWQKWRKQNPYIKPDLSDSEINNCSFQGDFSNVNLLRAKIIGGGMIPPILFINSNLNYSTIANIEVMMLSMSNDKAVFKNTTFNKAKILNSSILGADFYKVNFDESYIDKTKIMSSKFKDISFSNSMIIQSIIEGDFMNVNFSKCQLKETIILVSFIGKMFNVNFKYARILKCGISGDLQKIDFQNSDITGTSFDYRKGGSTFTNVNFSNANLTNVDFTRATFQNVIFKNADMTGAKLERKWYSYVKKQGVRNFDKIQWM